MIDSFIFEKINSLAGRYSILDALANFFSRYFDYLLLFIVIFFLFQNFKKYYSLISKMILAGFLARLIFVEIIRLFIERSRPFIENKVNLIFNYSNTLSFPSGHAAFYFAMATVIYSYNKKTGFLFFLASLLISLSRIFVGIHWPSDILAGAILGIISGIIINKVKVNYP